MKHKIFHGLRWVIMTLSLLFLAFGIRLTGKWLHTTDIPVFSCPFNTDQVIHSYCYYLSHLNKLVEYHSVKYAITYIIIFIILAIVFGRVFCGFICPMGYLQDIVWKIRDILHIEGFSRKEKFVESIKTARYLVLFVFLSITFFGFDFCSICPAAITTQSIAGFKQVINVGFIFGIILMILGFFMRRFWCNICPLGYLVGVFHKISLFRIKKDCTACTKCRACYEACPMKIKEIYTDDDKDVTKTECIFCGECIKKCPEDKALSISIGNIKIYTSSRKDFEEYHK